MPSEHICRDPSCFFCIMKDPDSSIRKTTIKEFLKCIPDDLIDDQELILVISWLWKAAMTEPENQEFPSLGIFSCMALLISKAIRDKSWLFRHQNIYIPYYAAHIIGSYTMRKSHFAVIAVESGVIPPLLELLKGKMSWVEQRVAVRALGHLASYKKTFEALIAYEDELVNLSMNLASSCLEVVYRMFVGVKERKKRVKYHRDLLTRGGGGSEIEIRKAEEWASQLQCWSIHLLNCFAMKKRGLDLMCNKKFLEDLCDMWGGLVNHSSPSGVGLLRTLCYSNIGRSNIAGSVYVVESLCNLSRSSDDWQYMGIDCLLLLLKDSSTRYKVIEMATPYLLDLIELRNLRNRKNIGESIIRVLADVFSKHHNSKITNVSVHEINRVLKQDMLTKELKEKMVFARKKKQQGNHWFSVGQIEDALIKYSEALELCPLKYKSERTVLYNSRAQCNLLLKNIDLAISDSTRALCISNPPNSHFNSLWIRSQAYDMKGMAKESLMDCLMLMNCCIKPRDRGSDRVLKVPYYVMCMIRKQMDSTWLFKPAQVKALNSNNDPHNNITRKTIQRQNRVYETGLRTISEDTSCVLQDIGSGRKRIDWEKRYISH